MLYKVILNFIGLHLKTEINEALVTNSKHQRSAYVSTTFMRFPCLFIPSDCQPRKINQVEYGVKLTSSHNFAVKVLRVNSYDRVSLVGQW